MGLIRILAALAALAAAPAGAAERQPVGAPTLEPMGHLSFCGRFPFECTASPEAPPLALDDAVLRLVADANRSVNLEIEAASDRELYGAEERWTLPEGGRGDCEDYALLKRKRLREAGIAQANLLMTVVRKRDGEGHAVLTLVTDRGDFVLDNLDLRVRRWDELDYTFVKRQSASDPRRWESLGAPATPGPVAAGR